MRNRPRAARTTPLALPARRARSPSRLILLDDAGERERRASVDSLAGWGTSAADDADDVPGNRRALDEKLAADDDEQEEIHPRSPSRTRRRRRSARRRAASDARTSSCFSGRSAARRSSASFAALPPQAPIARPAPRRRCVVLPLEALLRLLRRLDGRIRGTTVDGRLVVVRRPVAAIRKLRAAPQRRRLGCPRRRVEQSSRPGPRCARATLRVRRRDAAAQRLGTTRRRRSRR